MTATFAKFKAHFLNWREWELNPIVIKELRQAVRSWAVTGMLLLFLTVLFIVSIVFLVSQSFDVHTNMQLGASLFSTFVVILAGASIIFIPLYIGIRVAMERRDNNPDLLYVSTLSPARIVFGKFLCGAYMAQLFISACMPFMAYTNLLRGVDLPTVFYILFFLFLAVCAANQIAIFLACLPMSLPFKVLLALVGVFASFMIIGSLIAASFAMMISGTGAMMMHGNFWVGVFTYVGIGLALTGLLFVLSVALISPPSANRALPVRLYVTVIWLLGGLLNFAWIWQMKEPQLILVWAVATSVLMFFSLLVVISNADQIGPRVRRTIPWPRWKRAAAFLFFNGAAGGLLWIVLICAITYFAASGIISLGVVWFPKTAYGMSTEQSDSFFTNSFTAAAYALAYALTALFIQRKFFPHRPPKLAGLLAVLLAAAVAIVPSIVLFFLNRLSWNSVEGVQLGNVFNIFALRTNDQLWPHQIFAVCWLILITLVNAKWFLRQMKNFHPPVSAPPVIAEISPLP